MLGFLLPKILMSFAKLEGHISEAALQASLFCKLAAFQLVQVNINAERHFAQDFDIICKFQGRTSERLLQASFLDSLSYLANSLLDFSHSFWQVFGALFQVALCFRKWPAFFTLSLR